MVERLDIWGQMGFCDIQTDIRMDICNSMVASATENKNKTHCLFSSWYAPDSRQCRRNGPTLVIINYCSPSPRVQVGSGSDTTLCHVSCFNLYSGELLAVAGRVSMTQADSQHLNRVSFFTELGSPLATFLIPYFKVNFHSKDIFDH